MSQTDVKDRCHGQMYVLDSQTKKLQLSELWTDQKWLLNLQLDIETHRYPCRLNRVKIEEVYLNIGIYIVTDRRHTQTPRTRAVVRNFNPRVPHIKGLKILRVPGNCSRKNSWEH